MLQIRACISGHAALCGDDQERDTAGQMEQGWVLFKRTPGAWGCKAANYYFVPRNQKNLWIPLLFFASARSSNTLRAVVLAHDCSNYHSTSIILLYNRSYKLLQIEKLLKQNQTQSVIKRYQFACGKVVSCFLHLAPGVLSVEKVLSSLCVAIWYWKLHFKKFSVVLPGKLLSVDMQTVWN